MSLNSFYVESKQIIVSFLHSHSMTNSNDFQFFWYEGPLTRIAELCLRSFTRFSRLTIHLYSYDSDLDLDHVPRCVRHDASEFLPREIADHWKEIIGAQGIPAISTLFRYRLLYEKGGWYFDTDCILIKPLTSFFNLDYVFAWENAPSPQVCNAVIKFPKNTEMLDQLYKYCAQMDPKTWYPGSLVPIFTEYLRKFSLIDKALSPAYFYPISSFSEFQQPSKLEDQTYIVHLFTQVASIREQYYQKQIEYYQKQIEALNNSLSLRIGRGIPFGRTIRKLMDGRE